MGVNYPLTLIIIGFDTHPFFALEEQDVKFFDISTSKSGLIRRCFVDFDLEMCFAPQ